MENKKNIQSALSLEKIVFDKIEFNRLGFSSDKELEIEIQSSIAKRGNEDVYRIILSGFFTIEQREELTEELKDALITKNAIAILMPYLRSEASLLTAQPGMECVVLPAFNINKMLENS